MRIKGRLNHLSCVNRIASSLYVMKISIAAIISATLCVNTLAAPSSTQFHATCEATATVIEEKIKSQDFKLLPNRKWPDEFTWSGECFGHG
jgi:hypothetical protein